MLQRRSASLFSPPLCGVLRGPESQVSGDVLEEHSHAIGDVSDESDTEHCDRRTRQQLSHDSLHLHFLLFGVVSMSSVSVGTNIHIFAGAIVMDMS